MASTAQGRRKREQWLQRHGSNYWSPEAVETRRRRNKRSGRSEARRDMWARQRKLDQEYVERCAQWWVARWQWEEEFDRYWAEWHKADVWLKERWAEAGGSVGQAAAV